MGSFDDELARIFAEERPALTRYLTHRTASSADGEDLAQECWIRFARNGAAAIAAPGPYLRRIAQNIAHDHYRAGKRRLRPAEVDALLSVPDEAPDPSAVAEARSELRRLAQILNELPERRREILIAVRVKGQTHREAAESFGVSSRTVELEIRQALDYCADRLRKRR